MRLQTFAALAALAVAGSALQAGQVFISDQGPTSLHVYDDCGGTCFNYFSSIYPAYIHFEWQLSGLIDISQEGEHYSLLTEDGHISDVIKFVLRRGTDYMSVQYYTRGGAWDLDNPDTINGLILGWHLYRSVEETTGFQSVYDFAPMSGENQGTTDTLYVSSSEVATPEPANFALVTAAVAGLALLRRQSRRSLTRRHRGDKPASAKEAAASIHVAGSGA